MTDVSAGDARLQELRTFSHDDWLEWLERLTRSGEAGVYSSASSERHHIIVDTYHQLGAHPSGDRLCNALTTLFRGTPSFIVHQERLYALLQSIAYLRPPRARDAVTLRLLEQTLLPLHSGEWNLHTLCMVAASNYGLDETTKQYLIRLGLETTTAEHAILAFRLLGEQDIAAAPPLLERIIHLRDLPDVEQAVEEALAATMDRSGALWLYRWFAERVTPLEEQEPEHMVVFERILLQAFSASATTDTFAQLFAGEVQARRGLVAPSQLLRIAQLHCHLPEDDILECLRRIWDASSLSLDGNDLPWRLGSATEAFEAIGEIDVPVGDPAYGLNYLRNDLGAIQIASDSLEAALLLEASPSESARSVLRLKK